MGLASYGTDRYVKEMWKCVAVKEDGGREINFPREEFFDFIRTLKKESVGKDLFQIRADVAFAAQAVLEKSTFLLMEELYNKTKCRKLCYSGGVALNSTLNGKITKETPFTDIFIPPMSGDAGTAIGSALYGHYCRNGGRYDPHKIKSVYWGKSYSDLEIENALKKNEENIAWSKQTTEEVAETAALKLKSGQILGWFQGGCEAGPRALGNRSILADPRRKNMKDILNSRVKFRESFRPFAPSVLQEYAKDYFETDGTEYPFMLFVHPVKESKKSVIPAVTHVDGTARIQTVNEEDNPVYYGLINAFYRLTGVPVLLNTSFNIKGEPIIETPSDALKSFIKADMDCLCIGNYVVTKKETKKRQAST